MRRSVRYGVPMTRVQCVPARRGGMSCDRKPSRTPRLPSVMAAPPGWHAGASVALCRRLARSAGMCDDDGSDSCRVFDHGQRAGNAAPSRTIAEHGDGGVPPWHAATPRGSRACRPVVMGKSARVGRFLLLPNVTLSAFCRPVYSCTVLQYPSRR